LGAVIEGVSELANSPPQLRRGGAKRRGGVGQTIDFIEQHHPPLRGCPPQLRRAVGIRQFIHTFYDRAYSPNLSVHASNGRPPFWFPSIKYLEIIFKTFSKKVPQ
jgi:hypothetical protein